MTKIRITQSIFFILSLILIFLFINPPFPALKEQTQYHLLFLGAAGTLFVMFLQKELKAFEVKNTKDLFSDFAVGTVGGAFAFVAINYVLGATRGIVNLFGVFGTASVATSEFFSAIFLIEVIPLVETIMLVGGTLVIAGILRGKVPYPKVVAAIMVMFLFAAFHFTIAGKLNYEYSPVGFMNFIGNVNLGATDASGRLLPLCGAGVEADCISTAFPQFLLGGMLIFGALIAESWVLAYRMHATVNLISAIVLFGLSPTLLTLGLLQLGVVLIVVHKTKMRKFETLKIQRLFD